MKQLMKPIKQHQLSESCQTDQINLIKWKLLKQEIRKFAIPRTSHKATEEVNVN